MRRRYKISFTHRVDIMEEYQIFSSLRFFFIKTKNIFDGSLFFAEYQIEFSLLFSLSLLLSLSFFFVLVIFVFVSDHTEKERKRERINRLCHSDIAKMMFDYIIIRYLFILLLLSSIHLTVSQTTIEFSSDEPTGMLLIRFDGFDKNEI